MVCSSCKTEIEPGSLNLGTIEKPLCKQCVVKITNNYDSNHQNIQNNEIYSRKESIYKDRKVLLFLITILLIVFAIFVGSFHVLSSNVSGFQLIPRISFSFNEFFVNLDEITSMPAFEAKSKFPLTVKALVAAGILESDEMMQKRILDEINTNTKRITDSLQIEMKKIQIESERESEEYMKRIKKILDY